MKTNLFLNDAKVQARLLLQVSGAFRVNKVGRVLHAHRAAESFGRRAAGKRVRRVEVRAFIDPNVQSINQFAAEPTRENGNDDANPPEHDCEQSGCSRIRSAHKPTHNEQQRDDEIRDAVSQPDGFRACAIRNSEPVNKSKRCRDECADDSGRNKPIRHISPMPIVGGQIDNAENGCHWGAVPTGRQSTSGESGDQVRLLLISLASLSFNNAFAAQQPNGFQPAELPRPFKPEKS